MTMVDTRRRYPAIPGKRILIVEDRFLLADDLARMLQEQRAEVAAAAADVDRALERARHDALDAAILDIDLRGEQVFQVARVLGGRGIPFLFATGLSGTSLPPEFAGCPVVRKPYGRRQLLSALESLLSDDGRPAEA